MSVFGGYKETPLTYRKLNHVFILISKFMAIDLKIFNPHFFVIIAGPKMLLNKFGSRDLAWQQITTVSIQPY